MNESTEVKEATQVRKFDEFYQSGEAALKNMQKPVVENQVKRRLSSAYDDAETQKYSAEMKINTALSNLKNFDVNTIVTYKTEIDDLNSAQVKIKEVYKELFGVDFPVTM